MKYYTLNRRSILKGTALGAGALTGADLLSFANAWAADSPWKPEAGAKLSLLRWKRFVQSEDDAFVAMVQSFTCLLYTSPSPRDS